MRRASSSRVRFPTADDVELRGQRRESREELGWQRHLRSRDDHRSTTRMPRRLSDVTRASLASGRSRRGRGHCPDAETKSMRPNRARVFGLRVRGPRRCEGRGHRRPLCRVAATTASAASPIDDAGASFDPPGFVPAPGDRVECRGKAGRRRAPGRRGQIRRRETKPSRDVRIDAAVTSVDAVARTLVILGVTVSADGDTRLEDESDLDDENLSFSELQAGPVPPDRGGLDRDERRPRALDQTRRRGRRAMTTSGSRAPSRRSIRMSRRSRSSVSRFRSTEAPNIETDSIR